MSEHVTKVEFDAALAEIHDRIEEQAARIEVLEAGLLSEMETSHKLTGQVAAIIAVLAGTITAALTDESKAAIAAGLKGAPDVTSAEFGERAEMVRRAFSEAVRRVGLLP